MGYAEGDAVPWERWLVPADTAARLTDDGFLDDPDGPYAHLARTSATRFPCLESVPTLVIFGESGWVRRP